ncbi:AAA family ATPase [Pseudomonas putida]|uniref:AAA family ATPase n=1 Tax=Pseudomonas putida TaxID=303 RepID=UPI001F51903C|nr:AAA family ATPase [Pseudomonas putida]MCI1037990.1 AAA family ATPase [Pseudomonas putida]
MDFARLQISKWQQFSHVDISFHSRVTIITGSNGSGKTTILSFLSRHNGFSHFSLATPKNLPGAGLKYSPLNFIPKKRSSDDRKIGSLTYTNDHTALIVAPEIGAHPQYSTEIQVQQPADVLFIPSHRQTFSYRRVGNIPTARRDRLEVFTEYNAVQASRHAGNPHHEPSSLIMKNTLLAWMINGYGVKNGTKVIMASDPRQIKNFEGFRDILKVLLPESLGFEDLEVRDYEIVFICNGGEDEFLLETASGGISSLIDMAWQIYIYDTDSKRPFAVVIDEAENHLHPSMQRTLLPKLLSAFPHVKFIVSTHSPLIVTSVEDSSVYVLRYDEGKKVRSHLLNFTGEVKNAIDTLDQVLGVSTTIPDWAAKKFASILKRYESQPTPSSLASLRSDLDAAGLGRLFPQAIGVIAETNK